MLLYPIELAVSIDTLFDSYIKLLDRSLSGRHILSGMVDIRDYNQDGLMVIDIGLKKAI